MKDKIKKFLRSLLPPKGPENEAKRLGWIFKTLFLVLVGGSLLAVGVVVAIFGKFSADLPQLITVEDYRPLAVTRILASPEPGKEKEDTLIGEFYKERRYVIPYDRIPDVVVKAFISAEDDTFFEHPGINFASILRAGIANFRAGHVVQGGSTITQQVAKSLLLTPERSFGRKIKEVILASRIEKNLTKKQILYLYLNQIYLGHGAYGVQAAARTYYRKDISQVTIAEAAVLAGLPQAPGKYSPVQNPKKAKERQLYVLRRMYENGYATQAQMAEAAAAPLRIYHDEDLNTKYSGYLVEHIRRYLTEKYGDQAVYEDGLTVTVPTRKSLTVAAVQSLREGLRAVDKRIGYRGPLRRLKTTEEIETFLRESRIDAVDRKLGYQLMMADGHLDPIEAMKAADIKTDLQLLDPNELYEVVVLSFDNARKTTTVGLGSARIELPIANMKWARTVRDDRNPNASRPEPSVPSRVFQKGDVVLVKVAPAADGLGPVAFLEQEPLVQGALFSVDVRTGQVMAMEGGYDFKKSEFNRSTQAMRQPGSSFKPFIYTAAVERGYTPATIIVDSPIVYDSGDSGKWKPANFEEKFYGDTTFRQALIKSRNVPTIKIVQYLGAGSVIAYAKRLGLTGQFSADLSISLGSGAVSLLEMTRAYALYPRLGRKVSPIFLNQVTDRDGKTLEEQKPLPLPDPASITSAVPAPTAVKADASQNKEPQPETSGQPDAAATADGSPYPLPQDPDQVLDPRVAYVMTHLMKEVVSFGTGHEAKNLGRAAAGKTGTTNEYIDAWFMGFTPHVATGVWVGFDSQKTIGPGETGARAALPIWLSYMREAVKIHPDSDFTVPPGVIFASIDPVSGKLASPNSSTAIKEAFLEGTQPNEQTDRGATTPESQSEFFKEDIE